MQGLQLEQLSKHTPSAAGVMLPLLCTHSYRQFYIFKGKISFSSLLGKTAIEKPPVMLLFASETSLLKHKGKLLLRDVTDVSLFIQLRTRPSNTTSDA